MDVKAEFKNGACRLHMAPSDEWEKKLLGAVAKGGETLSSVITYKSDGHFGYGKCEAVSVLLEAGGDAWQAPCVGCMHFKGRTCHATDQWKDFSCRVPALGAA